MTLPLSDSGSRLSDRKSRPQKFLGFALQQGDHELLDILPDRQKEILLMRGSYQELAAELGVAVGTVRSRLHRARAALCELRHSSAGNSPESPIQDEIALN